jgi:PadR family transcriptional regulator PadR
MGRLNITFSTGQVLQALASGYHYGFDIMDATGLPSGTVYPILRRLDGEALVQSRWEKPADAQKEVRPPRRYYALTAAGQKMLTAAIERHPLLPHAVGRDIRGLRPTRA